MNIEQKIQETIDTIKAKLESGELVEKAQVEELINESLRSFAATVEQSAQAQLETVQAQQAQAIEAAVAKAREEMRAEMEASADAMLRSFALAQAVKEVDERVNALVGEGRVAPAQSEQVRALLISLLGVEGEARSYAADDIGEAGDKSLYTLFNEFLSGLPSQLSQQPEVARAGGGAGASDGSGSALYRAYMGGNKEAIFDLDGLIQDIRKAEPGLSYYEAFKRAIGGMK